MAATLSGMESSSHITDKTPCIVGAALFFRTHIVLPLEYQRDSADDFYYGTWHGHMMRLMNSNSKLINFEINTFLFNFTAQIRTFYLFCTKFRTHCSGHLLSVIIYHFYIATGCIVCTFWIRSTNLLFHRRFIKGKKKIEFHAVFLCTFCNCVILLSKISSICPLKWNNVKIRPIFRFNKSLLFEFKIHFHYTNSTSLWFDTLSYATIIHETDVACMK